MRIPFALPSIGDAEVDAAVRALRSGWMSTGPECAAFESEFLGFLNSGDSPNADSLGALAVNSATSGLHLALEAAGVGPGDEVIIPTWTFTATAEVVHYLGARPVLVDVEPKTLNISARKIREAISSRTRVIMPVHFAGLAADIEAIHHLAKEYDLHVIEDAAHALPSRLGSQLVGTTSSFATVFSFYATKTITTGEGGMVVSSNEAAIKRMKLMRLHGIDRDAFSRYNSDKPAWYYEIQAPGFKYNMTDLAAAVGRVQLMRAHELHNRRTDIAEQYFDALADTSLEMPEKPDNVKDHAWHLFVVRLPKNLSRFRDTFISLMQQQGVSCSVHFIPLHLQPYWRASYNLSPEEFPVATSEYARVVSLPIYPSMSDGEVRHIIEASKRVMTSILAMVPTAH